MKLDDVTTDVLSQMRQQSRLGVKITGRNEVPEVGPANSGLWFRVPRVTAVFADLRNSTGLNVTNSPKDAAFAYTYFIAEVLLVRGPWRPVLRSIDHGEANTRVNTWMRD